MLWHRFYGSFNIKRKRDNYAFITSDENMALSYQKEHLGKATYKQISINSNGTPDKWLVEMKINERVETDNVGLYTCVLGGGRMKLLEMIETVLNIDDNIVLNGVRVDSIYISYPSNADIDTKLSEFESHYCTINENANESLFDKLSNVPYRVESGWNPPSAKKILRVHKIDTNKYDLSIMKCEIYDKNTDYSNKNIFVQGHAGTHKTEILKNNYLKHKQNNEKCRVIAYTNIAVQNLIGRGVSKEDCMTIANFLGWTGTRYSHRTIKNFDLLSIDEYSMVDVDNWVRINKKVKTAGAIIQAFGDKWQCCAVDGNVKYDITKTQFLRELLGKDGLLLIKQNDSFNDDNGNKIEPRCDKLIRNIVTRMIDDPEHRLCGELFYDKYDWIWERSPTAISNTMICKTNNMVDKMNNKLNNGIKEGCKVMIHEINDKKLDVYNCERYIVKKMDGNMLHLEEWIANPELRYKTKKKHRVVPKSYVRLANACTTYKWQGNTIYDTYIIFEPHLMNLQEFITALTRAKKLTQIRITNKYQLQNKSFENVFESKNIYECEIKPRLQLYKLYIIIEKPTKRAYIGLTALNIEDRLAIHKEISNNNCKCKDFDFENSEIKLLGEFMAVSREDNGIERSYIQDYNKFSEYNIVNYRENNYKTDITTTDGTIGETTTETIDLSKKFPYHISYDKKSKFYYIKIGKIQRKSRFGNKYTKEEALKRIQKKRELLLKQHYPNLYKK